MPGVWTVEWQATTPGKKGEKREQEKEKEEERKRKWQDEVKRKVSRNFSHNTKKESKGKETKMKVPRKFTERKLLHCARKESSLFLGKAFFSAKTKENPLILFKEMVFGFENFFFYFFFFFSEKFLSFPFFVLRRIPSRFTCQRKTSCGSRKGKIDIKKEKTSKIFPKIETQ